MVVVVALRRIQRSTDNIIQAKRATVNLETSRTGSKRRFRQTLLFLLLWRMILMYMLFFISRLHSMHLLREMPGPRIHSKTIRYRVQVPKTVHSPHIASKMQTEKRRIFG